MSRFLVQHESCECKCRFSESICNSKQKWNMMNVGVSVKNLMIGVLVQRVICGILACVVASVIKQVKLMNI